MVRPRAVAPGRLFRFGAKRRLGGGDPYWLTGK